MAERRQIESMGFTKIRTEASSTVRAIFGLYTRSMQAAITNAATEDDIYRWIDANEPQIIRLQSSLYDKYLASAYEYARNVGLKETGTSLTVFNELSPLRYSVENGIRDTLKKAKDKTVSSLKSLGRTLKQGISKILPKRRNKSQPLTTEQKKKARATTEDIVKKLTELETRRLQDAITKTGGNGKIDVYEAVGIESVIVRLDTVNDDRRCKKCADLQDRQLSLEQAKSLLPLHPNCRCMWKIPSGALKFAKQVDPKTTKGLRRKLVLEQKKQEYKVHKLRERLDKRYQLKHIHNEATENTVEVVWNELSQAGNSQLIGIGDKQAGHITSNTLYISLKPLQQVGEPGTILRSVYHDRAAKKWMFAVCGSFSMPQMGSETLIPLLPESFDEYPYLLASNNNNSIQAIAVSPVRGYVQTGNIRSYSADIEDVIGFAVEAQLGIV